MFWEAISIILHHIMWDYYTVSDIIESWSLFLFLCKLAVKSSEVFRCPLSSTLTSLTPTQVDAHYTDVIMSTVASQITKVSIVCCSTVCSDADQRKYQGIASLAFVKGIHRWPTDPPIGPVTQKLFSFDDVIILVFINASAITTYITSWNCIVCIVWIYGKEIDW